MYRTMFLLKTSLSRFPLIARVIVGGLEDSGDILPVIPVAEKIGRA